MKGENATKIVKKNMGYAIINEEGGTRSREPDKPNPRVHNLQNVNEHVRVSDVKSLGATETGRERGMILRHEGGIIKRTMTPGGMLRRPSGERETSVRNG